jgi:hypothetical protein
VTGSSELNIAIGVSDFGVDEGNVELNCWNSQESLARHWIYELNELRLGIGKIGANATQPWQEGESLCCGP